MQINETMHIDHSRYHVLLLLNYYLVIIIIMLLLLNARIL